MIIFFLTSWFPSRVVPNHGNFIARHARLVARDHEVTVVTIQDDPALPFGRRSVEERTEDGYHVIQVFFGQGRAPGPVKVWLRLRAYARGMRLARAKAGGPDLLHGHVLLDGGMAASLYAGRWGIPYVLTEHSSAYHETGALPEPRGRLGRRACRNASVIMPVSDHLGQSMRELNDLAGRYRTVSNVVSSDTFQAGPSPDGPPFLLLHVSNFIERDKNITGLLRAFARLPQTPFSEITLHLAGDGDLAELSRQIEAAGVKGVTHSGPHTETEIADLMRAHHAFMLFSHTENQPVVLLEAQMIGRPCIATDVGGIPDIIEDGVTGYLVPAADEAALTAAILRLRDNYDAFDQAAIRERAVARYSETAVRAALNQEYHRATEENFSPKPKR